MAGRVTLTFGAFIAICIYQAGAETTCAPVTCDMACDYGYSRDASGCEICECQELVCRDVKCAEGKICEVYSSDYEDHYAPEAMCVDPGLPDRCKHPMEKGTCSGSEMLWYYDTEYDKCEEFMFSGCHGNDNKFSSLIECENACQPESPGCGSIMCTMYCEYGFQTDEHGCDICKCRDTPSGIQGDEQPRVYSFPAGCDENAESQCELSCQYGYRHDDRGCHVCQCHVPAHCMPATCNSNCQFGHRFDEQGCETCQCREQGECNPGLNCRMYCPYGFKEDSYGCPHCECREDPCKVHECPKGTFCHADEAEERPDAVCIIEDSWSGTCSEVQCMMFCEHGFKTDRFGCSICECLDAPRAQCPMFKCVPCHFGYAVDEQGCRTCECLENPCSVQNCEQNQVCETYRECLTIDCRHLARCTAKEQIRRAQVDITLFHTPLSTLDEDAFTEQLRMHIRSLLGVDDGHIKGVKVTRRDNQTLEVDFHVLVEENQDIEQDIQTFRTNLRSDMDEATLTYQDTAFIPQPESLIATYHSSGYNEMETAPKSNTTTIIIVACVVGALLLLILIAVAAAKIMHRRDEKATPRKNIIYKKADETPEIA